jgi:hypothetical protein
MYMATKHTREQLRAVCCASIGFFFPQSFHLFVVSSLFFCQRQKLRAERKEKRSLLFDSHSAALTCMRSFLQLSLLHGAWAL